VHILNPGDPHSGDLFVGLLFTGSFMRLYDQLLTMHLQSSKGEGIACGLMHDVVVVGWQAGRQAGVVLNFIRRPATGGVS